MCQQLFNSFDQPPIIDDSALDGVMTAQQKFYESRQFTDEMIRESGLPFTSQSISHHLNFTSAFIANGKATTFHDQWLTVDYVFYTKFKRKTPSNVRRTEPIGYSALQQIGYLELPSIAECVNTGPIPNPNLGSDHYSLAVEFVLLLSRVSHWHESEPMEPMAPRALMNFCDQLTDKIVLIILYENFYENKPKQIMTKICNVYGELHWYRYSFCFIYNLRVVFVK